MILENQQTIRDIDSKLMTNWLIYVLCNNNNYNYLFCIRPRTVVKRIGMQRYLDDASLRIYTAVILVNGNATFALKLLKWYVSLLK
jgi:hypothetical protein